jgi:RNA recognition motif-containing protein
MDDNNKKLFVANISFSMTDEQLAELFADYGTVESAKVVLDKFNNNRSRGFAFVEMSTAEEAQNAIKNLHDTEIEGRKIIVNLSKPKENNRPSGGGGRRY